MARNPVLPLPELFAPFVARFPDDGLSETLAARLPERSFQLAIGEVLLGASTSAPPDLAVSAPAARLRASAARGDFDALAERSSVWRGVRKFLHAGRGASDAGRFWFEFDRDRPRDPPVPLVFFEPRRDGASEGALARALDHPAVRSLFHRQSGGLDRLRGILSRLREPSWGILGDLSARDGGEALRVTLSVPDAATARGLAEAAGWRGDADEIDRIVARSGGEVALSMIDLDLAARDCGPTLGLEFRTNLRYASAAPLRSYFGRLKVDGLVDSAAGERVAAWAGGTYAAAAESISPVLVARSVSHVKINLAPARAPTAKAYLRVESAVPRPDLS